MSAAIKTGYVNKPVIHAAIALVIQSLVLVVLLVFTPLDIYALALAAVCYSFCMCIMNGFSIRRKLGYKQEVVRTFLIPSVAALGMGAAAFLVYQGMNLLFVTMGLLEKGTMHWGLNCVCLVPAVLIAIIIYFALVIKFGAINRKEMRAMPKGATLVKMAEKLHLL